MAMRSLTYLMLFGTLVLLLAACSQEPVEIHYGSDECAYCKMMITNDHFATQLITEKGKSYTFDSIECLAALQNEHADELEGAKMWVSDYNQPGHWLDARKAQYVESEVIKSPMGRSLLALPSAQEAEEMIREKPGTLLKWDKVSQIKTVH